jgi:hypothetical protein
VRRDETYWSVGQVAEGSDALIEIRSLGLNVPMREIYANVRFVSEHASGN